MSVNCRDSESPINKRVTLCTCLLSLVYVCAFGTSGIGSSPLLGLGKIGVLLWSRNLQEIWSVICAMGFISLLIQKVAQTNMLYQMRPTCLFPGNCGSFKFGCGGWRAAWRAICWFRDIRMLPPFSFFEAAAAICKCFHAMWTGFKFGLEAVSKNVRKI
jgi:hypothetical protein